MRWGTETLSAPTATYWGWAGHPANSGIAAEEVVAVGAGVYVAAGVGQGVGVFVSATCPVRVREVPPQPLRIMGSVSATMLIQPRAVRRASRMPSSFTLRHTPPHATCSNRQPTARRSIARHMAECNTPRRACRAHRGTPHDQERGEASAVCPHMHDEPLWHIMAPWCPGLPLPRRTRHDGDQHHTRQPRGCASTRDTRA